MLFVCIFTWNSRYRTKVSEEEPVVRVKINENVLIAHLFWGEGASHVFSNYMPSRVAVANKSHERYRMLTIHTSMCVCVCVWKSYFIKRR